MHKYFIVRKYLMDIIENSPPDTKIPSERDLIEQLELSRPTIQKAINTLQAEGYLYKIDRQGTFTCEKKVHKYLNNLAGFTQEAQSMGQKVYTVLLEHQIFDANHVLAQKMNIPVSTPVHYCARLRYYEDVPVMVDFSYFIGAVLDNATEDILSNSIYNYIENTLKLKISRAEITIDTLLPEKEMCDYLKIDSNTPVFKFEQIVRLGDGKIFEYSVSYKNPKYYKINVHATK